MQGTTVVNAAHRYIPASVAVCLLDRRVGETERRSPRARQRRSHENYDSQPPVNANNDFGVTNSIGWKF
jgi:hypothetical protein